MRAGLSVRRIAARPRLQKHIFLYLHYIIRYTIRCKPENKTDTPKRKRETDNDRLPVETVIPYFILLGPF